MKETIRLFVPPVLPKLVRKIFPPGPVPPAKTEEPRWCTMQGGPLAGRPIYLNPDVQEYQSMMLNGVFDKSLFAYADRSDLKGKVVFDIGGHIGFHTMNFAQRVGPTGKVFVFEPHPLHQERIRTNLSKNQDLNERVTMIPMAASDREGTVEFRCTQFIEASSSSMSFIAGASTPLASSHYKDFETITVKTVRIDDLIANGTCPPPDLMKIDVEGAESLVVAGCIETLRKYKPRLLVEVHSYMNMLNLARLLLPLNYTFSLIEEEDRGFFAIEPEGKK